MKYLSIFAALLFASASSFAQTGFELPADITLKEKEDYAKYETTVINAAKWLEETDMDQQQSKRRRVSMFVMQWIEGSPSVNVDINETLAGLYGRNEQLLVVYLASYARHVLENRTGFSKFSASRAGILSMIRVYKKGIYVNFSREMDRISHMTSSELDDYIRDKFTNTMSA